MTGVEFLVHIRIQLPPDMPAATEEELRRAELARGVELRQAGTLVRVWRVPGRRENWSLYSIADATALHDVLSSLPLWPWMDIDVHPLAKHPAEQA